MKQDKRRSKRVAIELQLNISNLFKQDHVVIEEISEPITVKNISKTGIGFICKNVLPLDYYFNAVIQIGDKDSSIYTVIQIIRVQELEDGTYFYGCEFVGLSPVFNHIFDELDPKM